MTNPTEAQLLWEKLEYHIARAQQLARGIAVEMHFESIQAYLGHVARAYGITRPSIDPAIGPGNTGDSND